MKGAGLPQKGRILDSVKHFGIYTYKIGSCPSDAVVLRRSKLKRTIEFSRNSSNNRNLKVKRNNPSEKVTD